MVEIWPTTLMVSIPKQKQLLYKYSFALNRQNGLKRNKCYNEIIERYELCNKDALSRSLFARNEYMFLYCALGLDRKPLGRIFRKWAMNILSATLNCNLIRK